MANVDKFLDKAFEQHEFADLVNAPISALEGVSDADGEALQKAFGVKTIGDLATNKFVLWAQAITPLGGGKK